MVGTGEDSGDVGTSFSCHDTHKSVLRSPPESARPGPHNSRHTHADTGPAGVACLCALQLGPGTRTCLPRPGSGTGAPRPLHVGAGPPGGARGPPLASPRARLNSHLYLLLVRYTPPPSTYQARVGIRERPRRHASPRRRLHRRRLHRRRRRRRRRRRPPPPPRAPFAQPKMRISVSCASCTSLKRAAAASRWTSVASGGSLSGWCASARAR